MKREDFWSYVDRSAGPDGCWPWTRGRFQKGYGALTLDGRNLKSHRVALELTLGRPLADRAFACHTCDNPPCCNPAHLYEGDAASNIADMYAHGRERSLLGRPRPDVTARLRREFVSEGGTFVDDDDWMYLTVLDEIAAREDVRRYVARVERGDGLELRTLWLDPVVAFVVGDAAEQEWGISA